MTLCIWIVAIAHALHGRPRPKGEMTFGLHPLRMLTTARGEDQELKCLAMVSLVQLGYRCLC